MAKIHDVTVTYSADIPPFPGNPTPVLRRLRSMDDGGRNNVSLLETYVHGGTHVDAPIHFIQDGYAMEDVPLETMIGPCRVAYFPDADAITSAMLDGLDLPADLMRLILRTRDSAFWDDPTRQYPENFVALTPDAAEWIVERGIRLVGIDTLSIERYREAGAATHKALLGAEVVIVEGLDLRGIAPGDYELICMPLKLKGSDGAPARVALIET